MKKTTSGFTIVELLIVVVVIAILAAISIVAYTGIQNRANDSAVQSDINSFVKQVMVLYATNGVYPAGNGAAAPVGMSNFPLARSSYATNVHNFYYCSGTVAGIPVYAAGAVSKSGTMFYYSSLNSNLGVYTGSWGGVAVICPGMLPGLEAGYARSYGYDYTAQTWFSWTQ